MLMYRRQKFTQVLFSILGVECNPSLNGGKHNSLMSDVKVISLHDVNEFLRAEILQLFAENHPLKVIDDILVRGVLQFLAEADVCEPPDADAVLWAELVLQEVATYLYDGHYIELISCHKQFLHIVFGHSQNASVCKVDDKLHHVWRHAWYLKDFFVAG